MAFQKTRVEGFQTATNTAGALVSALLAQGGVDADIKSVLSAVREIRDVLFSDIGPVVDADNDMLQQQAASAPVANTGGGGGNRRSTSADAGSGGGKVFSKADGLALTLNFGAFKGESIGSVIEMPASEAGTYGYPSKDPGSKPGKAYIEWLANDDEPARAFASRAAKAALGQ